MSNNLYKFILNILLQVIVFDDDGYTALASTVETETTRFVIILMNM